MSEILRVCDLRDLKPKSPGLWYGPWKVDRRTNELVHKVSHYRVDLEAMGTAESVLDWICQVGWKTWADDSTIAGLVRAVNDWVNPQSNGICGGGIEQGRAARRRGSKRR